MFRPLVRPRYLVALLVLLLYLQIRNTAGSGSCSSPPPPDRLIPASVVRVVDGDTLEIRAGSRTERVRLIGVDAPESSPNEKALRDASRSGKDVAVITAMGKEAAAFTRRYLAGRRAVGLEYGVQPYDRYGRALAYVWVGPEMFNVVIVREGYATAYTVPPNVRYASLFAACERQARKLRKGLWR